MKISIEAQLNCQKGNIEYVFVLHGKEEQLSCQQHLPSEVKQK